MNKRIFILCVFQLVALLSYGQTRYRIVVSSGSAGDGNSGCNGSVTNVWLDGNYLGAGGSFDVSVKPTSLKIISSSESSDGQCNNVVVVCSQDETIPITLSDCEEFVGGYGNCYGVEVRFTISPISLTISGPASNTQFCESDSFTLTAASGYGSYIWEYLVAGNWYSLRTTSENYITISYSDVQAHTGHTQPVKFRYLIGNCASTSLTGNLSDNYSFLPPKLLVENPIWLKPTCINGGDGSISATINRAGYPGENPRIEIRGGPNLSSTVYTNPNALSPGTYYVFARSDWGGCGDPDYVEVVLPNGPRYNIIPSAIVTSDYFGQDIKCAGGNAEVTLSASGGLGSGYEYSLTDDNYSATNVLSLGAGTHTIYVKDGCGTPTKTTTSVTVNDVSPVTIDGTPSWCNDGTRGKITGIGGGGTGIWQYSLNGGTYQSDPVFPNLLTGTDYTLRVRDQNECESAFKDIFLPKTLTASYDKSNPICYSGTGTIQVKDIDGGTSPFTYKLNSGTFGSALSFSIPTTSNNTVVIKDVHDCTYEMESIPIVIPPTIVVSATTTKVSCYGGDDGKITASATNTYGDVMYSLNGGTYQEENLFIEKQIGSAYVVRIEDEHGCTAQSGAITVDQEPTLDATYLQTANILCNGDPSAALNLTPSGGPPTGSYTFDWSSSSVTNFSHDEDVSGLQAGTYSVKISRGICSTTKSNIVITQPALLTSAIMKIDQSCNPAHGAALSTDGSIDLMVSGGTGTLTYGWSNGATSEDLSNLTSGTYDVTITDDNGCIALNTATLTEPTPVISSIGSFTNVTCNGFDNGVITIVASGGSGVFDYSLNGGTELTTATFSLLAPDNYVIVSKDQNGCSAQVNQAITEPDELIVTTHDIVNTTCGTSNGAAATTVTGGTVAYTYSWENIFHQVISTNPDLTDIGGGAYTVTVKDDNLCTATATALITSSDGPVISFSTITPTTCYNSNDGKADVSISGGAAPYAVNWNNGETSTTPIALFPGNNVIMVTDDDACVVVDQVDIPHPLAIAIDTQTITPPTCAGSSDASIALTAKGGSGGYAFSWEAGSTVSSITAIPAGEYNVSIKDSNQCTLVSTIKVNAIPELKINLTSAQMPTCFGGSDGIITVLAEGGNGNYTYQWPEKNVEGAVLSNISAGQYSAKVTDQKGCNTVSSFSLGNPVEFKITIDDKTICVGQKYNLTSEVVNGTYDWSSLNGFKSDQRQVTLTEPGTYTLKVINAKGCFAEDSFVLQTSTDLLHADLLMVTEAFQSDTVVVVDLSWPLPETTTWLFPSQASILEENAQLGYAFLQFADAGQYDVGIRVTLAECVDTYNQMITIKDGVRPGATGGRESKVDLIQYFEVYPNPNKGNFEIVTELSEVQSARLMIINTEGNKILMNTQGEGQASYHWNVSLPEMNQGTYFIVLKAGNETKAVRLLKL